MVLTNPSRSAAEIEDSFSTQVAKSLLQDFTLSPVNQIALATEAGIVFVGHVVVILPGLLMIGIHIEVNYPKAASASKVPGDERKDSLSESPTRNTPVGNIYER